MTEDKAHLLEATWAWELTKVIYDVMNENPEGFTSDDVWSQYRESGVQIPPPFMSKRIGAYFRSFHASGIIVKLKEYRTSTRPGGSPLPLYKKATIERRGVSVKTSESSKAALGK